MLEEVFRDVSRFDVIHFHCENIHFPFVRRHPCSNVTTLHGQLFKEDHVPFFEEYHDMPLVSISDEQRTPVPNANWQATVYHGLPTGVLTLREDSRDYLAFLGRVAPEKGLDHAIAIALKVGMPIKVPRSASGGRRYFQEVIEPMMKKRPGSSVHRRSAAGRTVLGNARAPLFPIDWRDRRSGRDRGDGVRRSGHRVSRGSVPGSSSMAAPGSRQQCREAGTHWPAKRVEPLQCRRAFDRRFTAMAKDYLEVYRRLLVSRAASGPRPAQSRQVPDLAKRMQAFLRTVS